MLRSGWLPAEVTEEVKVSRAHAAEWNVSPDRIVFAGFSAGATVTSAVVLQVDLEEPFRLVANASSFAARIRLD